ncbi:urease accessory protein UreE [Granulicoccus phenolivorans]|uniref:urease accessory protein UreE n=1 Tax=Granulicoccus phenolivorans TaxID=266854 RepID=UPI00041D2094|nr:urease accessory protein UreE [Granulicoccus phenolivorans]
MTTHPHRPDPAAIRIVAAVLGTTADLSPAEVADCHIERVRVAAEDRRRPRQVLVSDHGTRLGLQLPRGTTLHDGDILVREGNMLIVVTSAAGWVLAIRPRTMREMGEVAHALGNRHQPAQFAALPSDPSGTGACELVMPDDHTIAAYLTERGVPFERVERALAEPFRHAEHTH